VVVFKDYMDIAISIYVMLIHVIFNEIMTIFFVLANAHSWIHIALAYWNKSLQVDISPYFLILMSVPFAPQCQVFEGEPTHTDVTVFVWSDQEWNPLFILYHRRDDQANQYFSQAVQTVGK
jgi:hypothetical protein